MLSQVDTFQNAVFRIVVWIVKTEVFKNYDLSLVVTHFVPIAIHVYTGIVPVMGYSRNFHAVANICYKFAHTSYHSPA